MILQNKQMGVGLIEVLISLLLLAVAVLGFSSLQMTAVKTTDESLKRTQAMSVARGLSENIRVHIDETDTIAAVLNSGGTVTTGATLTSCDAFVAGTPGCNGEELAEKNALTVIQNADSYDVSVGMETCPGTSGGDFFSGTTCIIVAWNETNSFTAAAGRAAVAGNIDCADANGMYLPNSSCIIVEAY